MNQPLNSKILKYLFQLTSKVSHFLNIQIIMIAHHIKVAIKELNERKAGSNVSSRIGKVNRLGIKLQRRLCYYW